MKIRTRRVNPRTNEYLDYLEEHVENVIRSWNEMLRPALESGGYQKELLDQIEEKIHQHDSSKYSEVEFDAYLNWFYPSEGFPKDQNAYDLAWLHHQKTNPHHWQYWCLIRDEGVIEPLDMPFESICEMICDWHSFSATDQNSTAYNYYCDNIENFKFSPHTKATVEYLLQYLTVPLTEVDTYV